MNKMAESKFGASMSHCPPLGWKWLERSDL